MNLLNPYTGLYTDLYELTMAQGHFFAGRHHTPAVFDYFFRKNPYEGGFVVFAGLADLLEAIQDFAYSPQALEYLKTQGFKSEFLEYLRNFQFRGHIWAAREGEIVFPYEPIVRVEGTIIETQLIETLLLNLLNFESLIATKAARMRLVAGTRIIAEFGLRRAQGYGGMQATRAAIVGGANHTSNTLAGLHYGIPVTGTMAHAWVQSYENELTAFRQFAQLYPDRCILLVDTYDTLRSGLPNAITVAKELEQKGHQLYGVRLDSGDLAWLSKKVRYMLDQAGLTYVKIIASNQIDEYVIRSLREQQAPIDGFGIGTRLVTGYESPALDGVYKLSEYNGTPRLKISENRKKLTFPGRKFVVRYRNGQDKFFGDGIWLEGQAPTQRIIHPHEPEKQSTVTGLPYEPLLHCVMKNGKPLDPLPSPTEAAAYARQRLAELPDEHKRFEYPHIYKVGLSQELFSLQQQLLRQHIRINP